MSVARRRVALGLLLALVTACGGAQVRRKPSMLKVVAKPANAVVYVDEHFVGPARKLEKHPVALKPGTRRVTIQAPDHFPHDLQVELAPGVTTVEIALRPVPP